MFYNHRIIPRPLRAVKFASGATIAYTGARATENADPSSACFDRSSFIVMSLFFIFLDGVGLAPAGPDNPLADADMPAITALLGGPLAAGRAQAHDRLLLRGIDATLGIPGLPQSGTGQTALFTGVNAAALHGRHQPHVPPVAL